MDSGLLFKPKTSIIRAKDHQTEKGTKIAAKLNWKNIILFWEGKILIPKLVPEAEKTDICPVEYIMAPQHSSRVRVDNITQKKSDFIYSVLIVVIS